MKRWIKASSTCNWVDEGIEDSIHYWSLTTDKGEGWVSSFDNDGDWGYNARIDTEDSPAGGFRNSFRGKDSKLQAMQYAESILCKSNVRAADDVDPDVGDKIINAWNDALTTCDLYEEDIHTMSYEDIKKFEKVLERCLRDRKVDLSFKSTVIPQNGEGFAIEGLKVGGNIGGITSNLIRGVIKKAWEPIDMTSDDPVDELEWAKDHDVNVYIEDKFGYCNPSTPEKALGLVKSGNETQYSGYGSQAYIDETTVKVYTDYFGNIKVSRRTLRYD